MDSLSAVQNPPSGSASPDPDQPGTGPEQLETRPDQLETRPDQLETGPDQLVSGPDQPWRPPRWGLGDVIIGFFAGELLSAMLAAAVLSGSRYSLDTSTSVGSAFGQAVGHLATGTPPAYTGPLPLPLWLTALLQIPLWACLLGVPIIATKLKG